ncbi:MAG TPA: S-methyl-5'-thioadenosine phosphorylase [Polyangiaceae bacterium]|jgi:5'-methylthioadenosine phosphorylase|nr:S-methyl-5'-thioadenosine phosphorylase [Polyangiaceae bacterium]
MSDPVLGVIGGSGLYDIEGLADVHERAVDTPYGAPSDRVIEGRLGDARVLFLPRHGRGHVHPPHLVNYRANVCALKKLGATHLVSISAVGSMREKIEPGHVVIVDQFIDLTKRRQSTFFDEGLVAHVGFSDPVCPLLADAATKAAVRAGATVHAGGTYVCMEGPQFSTRAESNLYRTWGVDVIGMTGMPEAKLAREAELPYATVALATDYDCWHSTEEVVTVEAVIAVLKKNVALAKRLVRELLGALPDAARSPATGALRTAIITDPTRIDPAARERLSWLLTSNPNR